MNTAQMALKAARKLKRDPRLDFISLALRGKKVNMDGVIKMIDDMVVALGTEQETDDSKKEYCLKEFDVTEDKKKVLAHEVEKLEKQVEENKSSISTLTADIAALADAIKASDKAVAEATEQRKEENEDYQVELAANSAAVQLIGYAKNRMNKFYNPKLYKAAPKKELTEEERLTLAAGGTLAPEAPAGGIAGTGVTVLAQVAPGAAPEAPGAYKKSSEESGGVIAMIDLLVKDLDKEMTVAKAEETNAQGDYETMMK